jgi:hypothetical protein
MKRTIVVYFLIVAIFGGCQHTLKNFTKRGEQYNKGLVYTKIKSLVFDKETKATINVTYLNPTNPKKYNNKLQNFLIGIYIANDNKDEDQKFINNADFILTINDKTYIKIQFINETTKQYQQIPLRNRWARYYILSFENDDNKILNLEYKYKESKKIVISFQKE